MIFQILRTSRRQIGIGIANSSLPIMIMNSHGIFCFLLYDKGVFSDGRRISFNENNINWEDRLIEVEVNRRTDLLSGNLEKTDWPERKFHKNMTKAYLLYRFLLKRK